MKHPVFAMNTGFLLIYYRTIFWRISVSPCFQAKRRISAAIALYWFWLPFDCFLFLTVWRGLDIISVVLAQAQGESLNAFINRAITQIMERDNPATQEAEA